MTATLFALVVVLQQSAPAKEPSPNPSLIRVFVETSELGHEDEQAARRSSVAELAQAIKGKKKSLTIVSEKDQGDITVRIIQRVVDTPKFVVGLGPRAGQPPGGAPPLRTAKLRADLHFGEVKLSLESKVKAYDNPSGWKGAAEDLADQIDKWVVKFRADIVAARK